MKKLSIFIFKIKMTELSTHSIHDISKIEFGVYSPEEIRKMAVCKVDNPKLTGPGSVYDDRMGFVLDNNNKCATCDKKNDCWGHFGYIDLAEPVLHPMYYKMVSSFLKCVCKKCHRLLLTKDQIELNGFFRLKGEPRFNRLLKKLDKVNICAHCDSPQPSINYKSKDMIICMEYKNGKKEGKISIIMEVEDIKKIFDNIINEDVELMGFNPDRIHPRNLIITVLPVIPPCSRPYVLADGNTCDDDLTYQLLEILKINTQLSDLNIQIQKRQKLVQSLKFRISTMFNNSKKKAKHPTDSRPLKGIKERLVGKKGRIRENLMGKRVDFSARTVIGADATLKLGQFAIPYEVAKIHTKPEPVTIFNIDHLTKIVNEGKANFVTTTKKRKDENGEEKEIQTRTNLQYAMFRKGTELLYGDIIVKDKGELKMKENGDVITKNLNTVMVRTGNEILEDGNRLIRNNKLVEVTYPCKKNITLKIGDIVEKQLEAGMIGLCNRQPTLHRGSMLAVEVLPMAFKSFRFNLAMTSSMNADFDGDEMNLHSVQSYETEAELRMISDARLNIITAQESKPVITITQDSLVAAYLMTSRDFKLTRGQFSDICLKGSLQDSSSLYDPDKIKHIVRVLKMNNKKPDIYNGRGLISLLLPMDFNYIKKNNAHPVEHTVIIKQGVFLEGAMDKNIIGKTHGSIIQLLNKEYGPLVTSNFIDNMQFIGNAWLLVHGFSIGLDDCMITSQESILSIRNKLTECYTKAEGIEETTQNPGIKEVRITAALSQAKDIGMKIAKDAMRTDNNFLVTVTSGAKGDYFNISQITGLLGQQNLEGKRVTPTLSHGKRTLPHYPFKNIDKEREYESRGFIRHSFIHGLNPQEFFFHAMSGREGVADTAMSTAKSGYIQRRIVKICEDIQVKYDGTVRDARESIYQFSYGENGYDATKTVRVNDIPITCDISRAAERLNTDFELGISINEEEEVKVEYKIVEGTSLKISSEKKKLLKSIKNTFPESLVNEDWSTNELKQRLESLEDSIEKGKIEEKRKEEEEEEEDEENEDEIIIDEDTDEDDENEENEEEKDMKEDTDEDEDILDTEDEEEFFEDAVEDVFGDD